MTSLFSQMHVFCSLHRDDIDMGIVKKKKKKTCSLNLSQKFVFPGPRNGIVVYMNSQNAYKVFNFLLKTVSCKLPLKIRPILRCYVDVWLRGQWLADYWSQCKTEVTRQQSIEHCTCCSSLTEQLHQSLRRKPFSHPFET